MTRRWLDESALAALPPAMTKRALKGAGTGAGGGPPPVNRSQGSKPAATGMKAMQALGRLEQGELNKTEKAYEAHLQRMVLAGVIVWYRFEPLRMVLAARTTYTPDFLVQLADGHLEVHEVKGFWTDDARVKIKVAAQMLPVFRFVAIKMDKPASKGADPTWTREEF